MQVPLRASLLAVVAFGLASTPELAWDWPLAPPRVAATFGTFAKGRVVTGLALASDGAPVRAADDGELSFISEEGISPSGLPSALGSFVVVEQDKGLAVLYSHLAAGSMSSFLRKPRSGDVLGSSGSSGWIEGSGIVFQVFDRLAGSWVNPLLLLPPLTVDKPPVIRSLALSSADKVYVLGAATSLPQGTYTIAADVADPAEPAWGTGSLAPYGIRLSIDGTEAARDRFDVARGTGGKLLLFGQPGVDADELRTKEGRYALAERLFTRGRTSIEVSVEDAEGNKRSSTWTFVVE